MEQVIEKIVKYSNMPFIAWLFSPLAILMTGTVMGATKISFQFYPFLLLYLFLLLVKAMEIAFFKNTSGNLPIPKTIQYIFYGSLVLILVLLFVATNWIIVALLALYSLFVILAFYKKIHMESTEYYLLLQIFFQAFIIGMVSYYVQTNFLTVQILPYFLPTLFLIIPVIMNEQEQLLSNQEIKERYTPFQNLLIEKTLTISLICFMIGIAIVFVLFYTNNVLIWKQIFFFIILLLYLFPLLIKYFRRKIRRDLFTANFTTVIIVLYAIFLNI